MLRVPFKRAAGAVVLLTLGVALVGCAISPAAVSPKAESAAAGASTTVQVARVERRDLTSTLSYSGEVRARQQVNLTAKLAGRIEELDVDVGSRVRVGDVVAVLDHAALEAQVAQAEAGLAAARARLKSLEAGPRAEQVGQAEANLKAAQARLDQLKAGPTEQQIAAAEAQVRLAKNQLYLAQAQGDALLGSRLPTTYTRDQKEAQAGIAWEQIQAAEANLANLKAGPTAEQLAQAEATVEGAEQQLALARRPYTAEDLNQARAAVGQAEAGLKLARVQLQEATITAPLAGVVADRFLSTGALAAPGSPIVSIVSDEVEVHFAVEEAQLGKLRPGQAARLGVSAYPGETFSGTLRVIAPTGDQRSRTFAARIDPSDGTVGARQAGARQATPLRPGMFATIDLVLDERKDVPTIPRSAVIEQDGKTLVFVAAGGKAVRREVKLGATSGDRVEVAGGLEPSDDVILKGATTLNDGDAVAVAGR